MSDLSITISEGEILLHGKSTTKLNRREFVDLIWKPFMEDKEFQDIAIDILTKKGLVRLNHNLP